MRLFLYYVGHATLNSIKKLLKTWLAVFLLIILGSGLIGYVAGSIVGSVANNQAEAESGSGDAGDKDAAFVPVPDAGDKDAVDVNLPGVNVLGEDISGEVAYEKMPWEMMNITRNQFIELIVSGLFFLMLLLILLNSKKMSEIFLPADAVLLFQAPIRPQTVMLFRLVAALGTQLFVSIFMVFQLPNLFGMGLTIWGALSLLVGWTLILLFTTILQVLLYVVSSYKEFLKNNMKYLIGAFFGILVAIYVYFFMHNNNNLILAATQMFTGAHTYWIPFWGWLRGFCLNAIEGNLAMSMLFLGLFLVGMILMIVIVWNLRVDFYEDALIAAEHKATQMARATNKNSMQTRQKERSDKLVRDDFKHGSGANVFFFKTMYNRMRMGLIKGVTKTMLLYIAIAVAIVVIMAITHEKNGYMFLALAMAVAVFFRSLGNPLQEDTTRDFFAMIPASARAKLFWSLLGGLANTALDILLPMVGAAIWYGVAPLEVLLWMLMLLSIDAYGTVIGNFIMCSVSVSLSESIQKTIQIMFIMFGALPALMLIIVGLVLDELMFFMPFGILLNLLLAFLFFMLTPRFFEAGRK